MDQDQEPNQSVEPAPVCEEPANSSEAPAAVAAPGPAAGNPDNPLVAPGIPAAEPREPAEDPLFSKDTKESAESTDRVGKALDAAGELAKQMGNKGAGELGGKMGGLMGLPGDAVAGAEAYDELKKGDLAKGVPDAVSAVASTAGDVASAVGNETVGKYANAVKGGVELGTGAAQLYDAVTAGPIAPGQTGTDTAQEAVNGVENLLKGVADGAQTGVVGGAAGAAVGKALAGGMALGNLAAPLIFGDKKEDTHAATADGQEHGTTGNSAVDWVFGAGKYSNGRWSDSSAAQ